MYNILIKKKVFYYKTTVEIRSPYMIKSEDGFVNVIVKWLNLG